MKKQFLVALFFLFGAMTVSAQFDQPILPYLAASTPAVSPEDTLLIELCPGDTLWVSGAGEYPANGAAYQQSDSTSTFEWYFNDGAPQFGPSVFHVFKKAGLYFVGLKITDVMGFQTNYHALKRVLVKGVAPVVVTGDPPKACPGNPIRLHTSLPQYTEFQSNISNFNPDTPLPIPDGTGAVVEIPFPILGEPGEILESENDLKLCIKMEHSWGFDLDILLESPDHTLIKLQDQEFIGREFFFGVPDPQDEPVFPSTAEGYWHCWEIGAPNPTVTEFILEPGNQGIETLPAGSYQPFENFEPWVGKPITGGWVLHVRDLWAADNGTILEANLQVGNKKCYSTAAVGWNWQENPAISTYFDSTGVEVYPDTATRLTFEIEEAGGCLTEVEFSNLVITTFPDTILFCRPCDEYTLDLILGAQPDTVCTGRVSILSSGSGTQSDFSYTWRRNGQVIRNGKGLHTIDVHENGLYRLDVLNPYNLCIYSDSILIDNIALYPTPVVTAGPDIYLPCGQETVTLSSEGSSGGFGFIPLWRDLRGTGLEQNPPTVGPGAYILSIREEATNCSRSDTVRVFPVLAIQSIEVTAASCGGADGKAAVTVDHSPGTATYAWSSGHTGPVADNLSPGWYSVTVTLDDACSVHENIFIGEVPGCKTRIRGRVWNKLSDPDCFIAGGHGLENALIRLLPDDLPAFTDEKGYFEFEVAPGSYWLEYIENPLYSFLCARKDSFSVNDLFQCNESTGHDFFVNQFGPNLSIHYLTSVARIGLPISVQLQLCNQGVTTESVNLVFNHAAILEDVNLSTLADQYDPELDRATWMITDLQPGECRIFSFQLMLPANPNLIGLILPFSVDAPLSVDIYPADNRHEWSQTVTGSYDPNNKQVSPGTDEFGGEIKTTDSLLYYRIQFQNLGNDTAFTVVVRDTLDENLDIAGFQPGFSSHPYQLRLEGRNILVFHFENIHLPDSASYPEASQGFVTFYIRLKPGLAPGTVIKNSAAIFFDFNPPVITHPVVSVIANPNAVGSVRPVQWNATLFPNPTSGSFQILFSQPLASAGILQVFSATGALVKQEILGAGVRRHEMDLQGAPPGLYWLRVATEQAGYWTGRVVKQ